MDFKTSARYFGTESSVQTALRELPGALRQLMNLVDIVYALEYEALRLNPAFLDSRTGLCRSLKGETRSRIAVQTALRGSSLWKCKNETLAGAISMKSGCAIHGAVRDSLAELDKWTEDYEESPDSPYTGTGIAIALDGINLSMAHLSKLITNRLMRLTEPAFSGLPKLLGQTPRTCSEHQSTISLIDGAIGHLSAPCGLCRQAVITETGLAAAYKSGLLTALEILELLYELLASEAFYCLKIFELRHTKPDGEYTAALYETIKEKAGGMPWESLFLGDTLWELTRLLKTITFDLGGEGHYK